VKLTKENQVLYRKVSADIEQIKLGGKQFETFINMAKRELRIGASEMTLISCSGLS
jgi:hypothetical protein